MRRRGAGPGRMAGRRMVARMSRMRRRRHRRRRRRRIVLVGGLIAVGVHKLSKKDVERVEEQTGKPAEELTDEELEQAMKQLGIEGEEMTDEEYDYVDQQDAAEDDYIEELERLASLHDQGIITDEEFEAKKKELLDQ
jgi:predicted Zn-dependent peptidase